MKLRIQPQTTNIYNDYIDSLPLQAKGGGCVVGLTYSDNALFGKDDSSAVPSGGAVCGRIQIGSLSLFQEMRVVVALHSATSL